jgi:hypothetical protein
MRYPKDYGTVPRLLLWGLHLVWLFPWSALIWGLVRNFPKSVRAREKTQRVSLLLFIWIGIILIFFSFSSTQEYYTFPSLAAFALLIGKSLADLETGAASTRWATLGLGIMAALTLLTGAGMIALTWWGDHAAQNFTLSDTLTTNPEYYNLSFGHIHDLTPATMSYLSPLVRLAASSLIIGPLAAVLFALRKRWMVSFVLLAAMMIGVCHLYNAGMNAFEPVISSRGLAKVVQSSFRPGDKIVINDFYEKGSTLNYYTGLQVHVLDRSFGVLWYGLQDKTASKLGMTDDELLDEWTNGKRIFLFSEREPMDSFLSRHPDLKYRVLAEEGGKKIMINW